MSSNKTYIALLRGINVGGYHKVPMAELRSEMETMGFENVQTLLNSGNVIFDGHSNEETKLEKKIGRHLEDIFGFSIPILVRTEENIAGLLKADPFKGVEVTEDRSLYVSFLKEKPENDLSLPWISEDESFRIIDVRDQSVCSVVDLSGTKTTEAMNILEQFFGNDITTRNWNTLNRIAKKLS